MESKERQPKKRGQSNERLPEENGHPSSVKFSLSGSSFEDNNTDDTDTAKHGQMSKPGQYNCIFMRRHLSLKGHCFGN